MSYIMLYFLPIITVFYMDSVILKEFSNISHIGET